MKARALAMVVAVSTFAPIFAGLGVLPAAAASIGDLAGAGPRPNATRLSFTAGDSVQANVDVGSGNLFVTVRGLSLPTVNSQVGLGASYNSVAADVTPTPRIGRGWSLDNTTDVRVVQESDFSVTFYGPGGLTGNFARIGSGPSYTSAAGFKADLVKTASGWTLTDRQSRVKRTFAAAGYLVSVTDRNGNVTTITPYAGASSDLTIVSPAGPTNARTATVKTVSGVTTVRQPNTGYPRQVVFETVGGDMTGFTDTLGRSTSFGYATGGLLTSISAPGGVSTTFTYTTAGKVASITQAETSSTGPGSSTTRLDYPSVTSTLLAGPNTNQTLAVSVVPHTTYTINTSQRVSSVVDAAGRSRAKTYTANFDTASATAGSGTTAGTTTNTFGANSGESLTKSASAEGAAQSLSYTNPAGPSQYLPSGGSDDAANASTYTYNGTGNQLTATDASAAQAKVTYNTDGTVATATSPGNGTNNTVYTSTNKQTTQITPVTGSSLGTRNYTYDQYGRLATATNGRGITATYTYDALDRVGLISYTGGTSVSYGYDTAGRNNSRVDTNGTTTYTYDQLGRLTSKENTFAGGLISYTYNKASWLATANSTAGGTTTYTYDDAGTPTSIIYPQAGGGTATLLFATDNQGRRTDTWLQSNPGHTVWAARSHTDYDKSGRVTRVTGDTGTGDSSYTRVVDESYCYSSGTTPSTCTLSTSTDRSRLQWKKNNVTGVTTIYTYDTSGRLKKAVVSGGNTYDYTYNANSNRVTADAQTLTFNAGNQITTTGYTYDGAGNLTAKPGVSSITYTAADQLASVTIPGGTYTYKHAGIDNNELLYQTTGSDGTYKYAYGRPNAQGVPVVDTISRFDGTITDTAAVTSDPVTGQPLLLRTPSGTQSLYIYNSRPGSPVALLSSNSNQSFGYDYDPFGVPVLTQSSGGAGVSYNPYLFAGGVQDRNTGWIHYGARYYDPTTATFTQQDTLDAPLDPNNGNRYAYAANDPINNVDPTGRDALCQIAVAGTIFSGVGLAASAIGVVALGTASAPVTGGLGTAAGLAAGYGLGVSAGGLIFSAYGLATTC